MKLDHFTLTAIRAARKGSEVLLRHFNRRLNISYKGSIDPVTQADRASQEAICRVIRTAYPEHVIFAEEDKRRVSHGEYRWIVDPLDGTVNFIHGISL